MTSLELTQKMRKTYHYSPLALAMLLAYPVAHAQNNPPNTGSTVAPAPIQLLPAEEIRLGEFLAERLNTIDEKNTDENALAWQSTIEQEVQEKQRLDLMSELYQLQSQPKGASIRPLVQWLDQLPATGRVVLNATDPRVMQAQPHHDPVLKEKDVVHVYPKSHAVTVLFDNAQACRVQHQSDYTLQDYIQPCVEQFKLNHGWDVAYLILPNGQVNKVNIAQWNAEDAVKAMPGAWIFLPNQKHGWTEQLLQRVSALIAWQGVDLPLPQVSDEKLIVSPKAATQKPNRDAVKTSSDWGITGLLQTPTARMNQAGMAGINITHVQPYTHYNLLMQPFDILEVAMRYTSTDGVSYGAVSPNQDHKDKSIDVKLKLLNESRYLPAVAVGLRDPMGTSLFGGEYVVANKRYGDFDLSLGLGWGYSGARGQFDNPLQSLGERFKQRTRTAVGQGGNFTNKTWFTGKTALFGGVQWHSPYQPLIVKVEYDGNDYKNEYFLGDRYQAKSPINVGLVWQKNGLEWTAGLERGEKAVVGVSLKGDFSQLGQVKQTTTRSEHSDSGILGRFDWSKLGYTLPLGRELSDDSEKHKVLQAFSEASHWQVSSIQQVGKTIYVYAEHDDGTFVQERLQGGLSVLDQIAPSDIERFAVILTQKRLPVAQYQVNRNVWKTQVQQLLPPSQRIEQPIDVVKPYFVNTPLAAVGTFQIPERKTLASRLLDKGQISFSPSLHQSIGGPDGYLYGVFAKANLTYNVWDGAWLDGTLQARIVDNYDKYRFTADSNLHPVRTNIRDYMTSTRLLMPNLQFTQFKPLGHNVFALGYVGYLESMFAGVGGELLYRQPNSRWAIGADVNHVRQRGFKQDFDLQSYHVNTGHLNLYWDTPFYDVVAKLSAGQYLAGDRGATLDLSRRFNNGVKMGAWATKTNVSAAQFGEGSMDKGVYIQIPFDALFRGFASGHATLVYQPLLRDGGARLHRRHTLYDLTAPLSKTGLEVQNPVKNP